MVKNKMTYQTQIEDLSQIYQVPESVFRHGFYDRDISLNNIYSLLTNPHIKKLTFQARDQGVFSRADRKKSSRLRFNEFMQDFTRLVGETFKDRVDLSVIVGYQGMKGELSSFKREQPTAVCSPRKKELTQILDYQKNFLCELGMYPNLYGSFYYGDAMNHSDFDLRFLISDTEKIGLVKEVIGCIEWDIERYVGSLSLRGKNIVQASEIGEAVDVIDSLIEIKAVLSDILAEDTTIFGDYLPRSITEIIGELPGGNTIFLQQVGEDYSNCDLVELYPYNWILEGESLITGLGQVEQEVAEVREMIETAAEIDPLFELMMCFSLYKSIEKRKKNLKRK